MVRRKTIKMKILKNKTYNELLEYKNKYFDLLWKPMQEKKKKVTDDDLLRDNANLYAENKKLKKLQDLLVNDLKSEDDKDYMDLTIKEYINYTLNKLEGDDKDE